MLINNEGIENTTTGKVKFINYTGKYPNLCNGILTLEIEGELHTFGQSYKSPTPEFCEFWRTSGCSYMFKREQEVKKGEWFIDVDKLPEEFEKYAVEIDKVFNDNVKHGCCGGCV